MLILLSTSLALAQVAADSPRCLDAPPPDGVYAAEGADPVLARPVAVVAGCVGATRGEAWSFGVRVVGGSAFEVVDADGKRCSSGTTAKYAGSGDGLTGLTSVWTNCGGATSRDDAPVALIRVAEVEALDEEDLGAAFGRPEEAVRAAALEAIARKQPEEWTCEPLARAVRGSLGAEATDRVLQLASAPCLADDLRVALFDHRLPLAAEALARTDSPREAGDDLVRAIEHGLPDAVPPLAGRIASLGTSDPTLRDHLARALVTPDGTTESRRAAVDAIDRLYREPSDGEALIAAADGHECTGWDELLETAAVRAYVGDATPRAARKLEAVRARCGD